MVSTFAVVVVISATITVSLNRKPPSMNPVKNRMTNTSDMCPTRNQNR